MSFYAIKDKPVNIFGLGKTGLSVARYFERVEQPFIVVDTREAVSDLEALEELKQCKQVWVGKKGVTGWEEEIEPFSQIVVSPGVNPNIECLQKAIALGCNIVGDIEIFAQNCKKKIIAITGSNGKSTVTELTYKLLLAAGKKACIGGNFGVPALDYLPNDESDYYVLELSSFQLDTTQSLQAEVAVVLNVSEDHMDRYPSFEAYRQSKLHIYDDAKHCIANADDKLTLPENKGSLNCFSLEDSSSSFSIKHDAKKKYLAINQCSIVDTALLALKGSHNWSNALASIAILNVLNVDISDKVISALKNYSGLSHRFQLAATTKQADWINDSKATNVGATIAALESIDSNQYAPVILIAGGQAKGADLSPLRTVLKQKVSVAILFGQDAKALAEQAADIEFYLLKNMQEAVAKAKALVNEYLRKPKRALVLLSPACASLDMYPNFEARGNDFCKQVEAVL